MKGGVVLTNVSVENTLVWLLLLFSENKKSRVSPGKQKKLRHYALPLAPMIRFPDNGGKVRQKLNDFTLRLGSDFRVLLCTDLAPDDRLSWTLRGVFSAPTRSVIAFT